jgi:hypothetical protein
MDEIGWREGERRARMVDGGCRCFANGADRWRRCSGVMLASEAREEAFE